ncbi:disease resistance protein RUN1-like isoform X2 [Capsicum annuum]|uniref:disease resistance protein RUN1-like isoform X2 n=1 Tax=Capsicum annuum TaxID=4072 RepID=UPI001FB0DD0C|nr:disease resistance protein RUN1-like isoform X2 [Capsicum annuum]
MNTSLLRGESSTSSMNIQLVEGESSTSFMNTPLLRGESSTSSMNIQLVEGESSTSSMNIQLVEGESSTSSQTQWSYDVFLSFRGEDTRNNFTGHLYTRLCQVGVNTFIDDEELRKGDVISTKLEKAIEDSRISIIVFSKSYASSSWCLDELVKILECKEQLKQTVLPIFYDVDPSHVRKQTGEFGKAFVTLKERSFTDERVEKWRAALTEAANLSGWDSQNVAGGHESKCIESIIKQVLQEVNQTPLDVASYPVGLDSRIEHIELLLQSGCEDEVRMVGIYGVGGIGKTTLAKAVFNRLFQQFDSSCFLSDIGSKVEELGLVKVQEKLLHQILKRMDFEVGSVAEGVNLIKARLGSKKVLIVLDDVDHKSQLESLARERSWFGSGSLIIITTRNKQLLSGLGANERYETKILNYNEAMQLFSWHAFQTPFPPHDYVNLAQDIIEYSGGLPLALVTLGSRLQGRSIEEWRYEANKLRGAQERAIPHLDIQKTLDTIGLIVILKTVVSLILMSVVYFFFFRSFSFVSSSTRSMDFPQRQSQPSNWGFVRTLNGQTVTEPRFLLRGLKSIYTN